MKYLLTTLLLIGIFFTTVHGQNADIDLLRKINVNRNKSLDPTFKFVSNSVLPLTLAVPATSVIYALIKKDSAKIGRAHV